MVTGNFIPLTAYWLLRSKEVQQAVKNHGGPINRGFPGAEKTEPQYLMSDPLHLTGFTLYYNGGAGQLAVLEVKKSIERGTRITIIAKNISDMLARDFVLVGASVNLIDFDTRPIRLHNLVLDGILVHAILGNGAGYGQVLDLKREEKSARDKNGRGLAIVYVLGNFGPVFISRTNGKGLVRQKGSGKRDDIVEAGGNAIDLELLKRNGSGSKILSYALN